MRETFAATPTTTRMARHSTVNKRDAFVPELLALCRMHCGSACGRRGAQNCSLLAATDSVNRPFIQCGSCGFVFNPPPYRETNEHTMPSADTYVKNMLSIDGLGYMHHEAEKAFACFAAARSAELARSGQAPRLLEVGSALGFLLATFRSVGWDVRGYEMWPAWRRFGREMLRLPISGGNIFNATFARGGGYDMIILTQVYEHVADFARMMDTLHSLLVPGGMLFISVPNFELGPRHNAQSFAGEAMALDNTFHINHWSLESLRAAAVHAGGFRPEQTFLTTRGDRGGWEIVLYAVR